MPSTYVARISQWIEKRFNAKGGNVIVEIDPSARTTLLFPSGVEDRYLQGWNRFTFSATLLANAANSGAVRFRNPAASGAICVIEGLFYGNNVATYSQFSVQQGAASTDLSTSGSGFRQDPRGNPLSTAIVSVQNVTPGNLSNTIGNSFVNEVASSFIVTTDQELVVLPGDAVQLVDLTVNELFFARWVWRERALEQSELT